MDRKWTFFRVLVLTILFNSGGALGKWQKVDDLGQALKSPYVKFQSAASKPSRISALEALSHVSKRVHESGPEKRGFYGFLGCVVNEDLCMEDEICIDDGLFGSCQSVEKPFDRYQYELDPVQQNDLEKVLIQLIRGGYSWRDLYTQCVVGDFLLAFQLNQTPDPEYCNDGTLPVRRSSADTDWKEDALSGRLGSEYETEPNWERVGDESAVSDDEFVNIHKYQKQRRRQPFNPDLSSFKINDEVAEGYNMADRREDAGEEVKGQKVRDAILQYLAKLKSEDLNALDEWLSSDTSANNYSPKESELSIDDVNPQEESELKDLSQVEQASDRNVKREFEQKRVIAEYSPAERAAKIAIAPARRFDIIDTSHVYFTVEPRVPDIEAAERILTEVSSLIHVPVGTFSRLRFAGDLVDFRVDRSLSNINGSAVASATMLHADEIKNVTGYRITRADVGRVPPTSFRVQELFATRSRYFVLLLALCGVIVGLLLTAVLLYLLHRYLSVKEKIARISDAESKRQSLDPTKEYQELCRQHMSSKLNEKPEPVHFLGRVSSVTNSEGGAQRSPSSRSSTSSWSEEPVSAAMDILTGHMILSYMEDHLKTKDRLNKEWESLKDYEPEVVATSVADQLSNKAKNRYLDIVPYDHSRVVLQKERNQNASDYINASTIMDHDPRNPAYIVTQGPLQSTVADFWQMIWEQGCVVIVNLTKQKEQDTPLCHTYWPSEGSVVYHTYEVNLVSEHIWCDDYLIRSFYLKNLQTNETRTVTQFHYVTWSDLGVPSSCKALLDFRRKVNKSFRGRSCPILIHCSDGAGRSGTYCLIDMVLNRISKGVKEIDIAATLEHIRDQRMQAVKTKEQFQFVLATVAEEVHAILKALPQ